MNLSAEQQKKIEENKAAALLKKQQYINKINSASGTHGQTSTSVGREKLNNNSFQIKFPKKGAQKQNIAYLNINFTAISENRFIADTSYHEQTIEIFKTIPGRLYDSALRKWTFPLSEHSNLSSKLKKHIPEVLITGVPVTLINALLSLEEPEQVDWSKIDKTLRDSLMPFQVEGVRFGIKKKGRCLIADDMGLGKTLQALGIACYFKENWPLLIICPTSMRYPWQEAVSTFFPNINPTVSVLTSGKDPHFEENIIITSYDLMKNCSTQILKKKFGVIIFDESHSLKNSKSARTKVALQLSEVASQVILLSGTPALSRPLELYSQILAIDPYTFRNFFDFGIRYCDGKKDRFGWNYSGSSNLEELELYLKKKIMIRRLKTEVMTQLPGKVRKLIVLNPSMIKTISKQLKSLKAELEVQKGAEKHSTLLSYYAMTGLAKLNAVCEYIEDKLESTDKFLVFAHHTNVMNGICDLLDKRNFEYIRIDGSVSSEERQNLCKKFQNKNTCRVAVLSLKAANAGITLTEAQLVIFAELYWNPGELIQAEDRVHRIGQRDSVLVEYLIAKGTADDHLWNLVQSKLNVLNKVGLSNDNFKNTDTKHLQPHNQLTLTSMFEKISNTNNELMEGMADDDIFDCINLEEIENEYCNSSKKIKRSSNSF